MQDWLRTNSRVARSTASVLSARGREADEQVGGAAQRLGAHLARVESNAASAAARVDEAGKQHECSRRRHHGQGCRGDRNHAREHRCTGRSHARVHRAEPAAFQHAGEEAARNLSLRLETIATKIETRLAISPLRIAASHALLNELSLGMAELDRLRGPSGGGHHRIGYLERNRLEPCGFPHGMFEDLDSGHERAKHLIERAHHMADAFTGLRLSSRRCPSRPVPCRGASGTDPLRHLFARPGDLCDRGFGQYGGRTPGRDGSQHCRHQQAFETSGAALSTLLNDRLGEVERRFNALNEWAAALRLSSKPPSVPFGRRSPTSQARCEGGHARAAEIEARAREIDAALAAISPDFPKRCRKHW
jgi:hypothetical protein